MSMRRQGCWTGCSGDHRKSLQSYCACAWRRPAVLAILMHMRVHCGCCAEPAPDSDPGAATARHPLATPCSDFLRRCFCGARRGVVLGFLMYKPRTLRVLRKPAPDLIRGRPPAGARSLRSQTIFCVAVSGSARRECRAHFGQVFRKRETRNRGSRLRRLAGLSHLVQVHVALRERNGAAGSLEFRLELFEQLVADLPVIRRRDPGADGEIDA